MDNWIVIINNLFLMRVKALKQDTEKRLLCIREGNKKHLLLVPFHSVEIVQIVPSETPPVILKVTGFGQLGGQHGISCPERRTWFAGTTRAREQREGGLCHARN